MTTNHRERVLAALEHREPDRVPRYARLDREVVEEFQWRTGQQDPAEYWGWDFRYADEGGIPAHLSRQ